MSERWLWANTRSTQRSGKASEAKRSAPGVGPAAVFNEGSTCAPRLSTTGRSRAVLGSLSSKGLHAHLAFQLLAAVAQQSLFILITIGRHQYAPALTQQLELVDAISNILTTEGYMVRWFLSSGRRSI